MIFSQIVEHEKEINNLRILGFSPKQFFQLFIAEIIPVTFFGLVMGCLLSLVSSKITVDILTFNIELPRYELMFPIIETSIIVLISLIIALLTTIFTVRVIFRREKSISRMERLENI